MEPILPEQTKIRICLMVSMIVGALEGVKARFALLSLKLRRVSFFIHFATPPKLAMIFGFVRSVTLDTLGSLNTAEHSCMSPLLAILALRDTRIHIGTPNGSDVLSNIEASVDEIFSLTSTLGIPDVKLYD